MNQFPSMTWREAHDLLCHMIDLGLAVDGNPWVLQFAARHNLQDTGVSFVVWRRIEASTFGQELIWIWPDSQLFLHKLLTSAEKYESLKNQESFINISRIRFGTKS